MAYNLYNYGTAWSKIGFTPVLTTAISTVWSLAGAYVFPAAAQQMEVVSSDNTQDKAGGTGALQVTIGYLDANYAEKTETVTLTGTAPVDTVATNILRINSFQVTSAGTGGAPVGNLSLRNTAGNVTYSYITLGFTRARNSVCTVPAGQTLYITGGSVGYGYAVNQTHYARMWIRANQNNEVKVAGIYYPLFELISQSGSQIFNLFNPIRIVEKVDLFVGGIGTVAGVATSSLQGWLQ